MLWSSYFGKILMTLFISMAPVVELRGAIPIATANGLDFRTAVITAVIGNLIPVPFIILFIRRIFGWLRRRGPKWSALVDRLELRAGRRADAVRRCAFWGLALFVAVPLPGTGAWTGALIAAMLRMRMKRAFPSIALGVAGAAAIVAAVTCGVRFGANTLLMGGN